VRGHGIDPEGAEITALAEVVDFAGLRVLELVCGNDRLTRMLRRPCLVEIVGG
jgi:hypothetical protein